MSFLRSPRAIPYLLLLPAILVILAVVLVPLLVSFWTSFTGYNLIRPNSLFQFVGLRNYQRLLGNEDFWWAFGRTVLFITVTLNVELVLGLGLALLINKITWGQRTLRTIMMFPMMFSPILVGFQFKYIFNDAIGLVNSALFDLGLIDQPIPWLVDGVLANFAVCLAVWVAMAGQTATDKILGVIGPIALFVAAGFEHSVANMFMLPMGLIIRYGAGDGFWAGEALTSAGVDIDSYGSITVGSALWDNMIPVILGNIVGGAVLVGAYFWAVYRRADVKAEQAGEQSRN